MGRGRASTPRDEKPSDTVSGAMGHPAPGWSTGKRSRPAVLADRVAMTAPRKSVGANATCWSTPEGLVLRVTVQTADRPDRAGVPELLEQAHHDFGAPRAGLG